MLPNGNGKGTPAAPKLTGKDSSHVELKEMLGNGDDRTQHEDIMQLARLGDIAGIQRLYDDKKFEPTYCDHEGISPLHVCYVHGSRCRS